MLVKLEFDFAGEDGCQDEKSFRMMLDAPKMMYSIEEIWTVVFRPYWQHGYDDPELEELTNKESINQEELSRIIELLGDRYLKVLEANRIGGE